MRSTHPRRSRETIGLLKDGWRRIAEGRIGAESAKLLLERFSIFPR